MPSKTKMKNAAIAAMSAALPKIPDELIDQIRRACPNFCVQGAEQLSTQLSACG